jgi:hypothetical protein
MMFWQGSGGRRDFDGALRSSGAGSGVGINKDRQVVQLRRYSATRGKGRQ